MKILNAQKMMILMAVSAVISLSINEEAPKAQAPTSKPVEITIGATTPVGATPVGATPVGATTVVAIVDTGADLEHELIQGHLWSNPGETGLDSQGREKSSNGIDDDANGFIDDVHGWNFISNSNNVEDHHGHGTHIAGIIAGALDEDSPVQLMILKYYDSQVSEQLTLEASNKAIAYALSQGVDVINYSGGGNLPNPTERDLFKRADQKKIYVVAAAGNDGHSTDRQGFYPASYGFDHVISVASTDSQGNLLPSSNKGPQSVDVAALGLDVFSSLPHDQMGFMTGTSQATAEVTAVLASLMSHSPLLSTEQIKKRLILTARTVEDLKGKIKNPKIPDRDRALSMRDQNEFSRDYQMARSRVQEVFDNPLENVERNLSSSRPDKL